MLRQREQARPLLGERLGDPAAFGVCGHLARVGDRLDPGGELRVEVVDGGERAGVEERVAQVANGPLDLPLLVSPVGRARLGGEVVVARQLEQAWMEADGIALPLQHSRLEVVVEQSARHAAEPLEGAHMAADEALQGLVEGEAREHGARPAQHHDEARQRPLGLADEDGSEAPPVDLGLLPRQRAEAEEGLLVRRGTDGPHVPAQLHHRARVPTGRDHVEEPRREQLRVVLERELDEALVRLQDRVLRPVLDVDEARRLDGVAYRVVVDAQLGADGPHLPVLGEEQPPHAGAQLFGDHRATSSISSRSRS